MANRRGSSGRARSEILIVAVVTSIAMIYFLHRMGATSQAKVHVSQALAAAKSVEQAAMDYREANKEWPESIYDMHLEPHMTTRATAFTVDFTDAQVILTFDPDQDRLAGKTLVLKSPTGVIRGDWSCSDGTVDMDYRPKACLPYSL